MTLSLCVCVCVCVCVRVHAATTKATRGGEPDKFKCTVYQHSFMLLVLPQPSLLGISFMCAALSNVTIMSLQIKLFHFITKLIVVQFQNVFCATHLAIMACVSIWFIGKIIKYYI